ncbi:hypothetical protein, partial [Mitsuokella multacida]|uniref:hypothetical protein n=1 Tax=Mitsuokella multacida TaxID=52226 RepID=UPI0022E61E62
IPSPKGRGFTAHFDKQNKSRFIIAQDDHTPRNSAKHISSFTCTSSKIHPHLSFCAAQMQFPKKTDLAPAVA